MNLLRRIKIGTRLIIMFGFLVIALLYVAYGGITSRLTQIRDTGFLKDSYIDHLDMLTDVNITTGNLFLSYRNYYLEYPDQEKCRCVLTILITVPILLSQTFRTIKKRLKKQTFQMM